LADVARTDGAGDFLGKEFAGALVDFRKCAMACAVAGPWEFDAGGLEKSSLHHAIRADRESARGNLFGS
jgi:hypothetical protein